MGLFTGNQGLTLADRISTARDHRFVGRTEELELFAAAVTQDPPPWAVLAVYGPGGTGKTMLLGQYARLAREAGWRVASLDARNLQVSPPGILAAVEGAVHSTADRDGGPNQDRLVLILDTCEVLAPLETWLRETLLPQLPASSMTVMASRNPPDREWLSSPGWGDLVRVLPLRNLHPAESRRYLEKRNVPLRHHEAIVEFTHGHPLALSLVADAAVARGDVFDPKRAPDIIESLMSQFLRSDPSPLHRKALEISARARITSESLLASAFGDDQGHVLFSWLQRLSFMDHNGEGLFPHDLVREVIEADLRWRHPVRFEEIHRIVHRHVVARIAASHGQEKQRELHSLMFLHRNNPIWQPYVGKDEYGHNYVEPATRDDWPTILEIVGRHEGPAAAELARYWLSRKPEGFHVVRGLDGQVTGIAALLYVDPEHAGDIEADPVVRATMLELDRVHPVRAGDQVGFARYVMGNKTYRNPSTPMSLSVLAAGSVYTRNTLAVTNIVVSEPEFWEAYCNYVRHGRNEAVNVPIGNRTYAVFSHDWRVEPIEQFDEILTRLETSTDTRLDRPLQTVDRYIPLSRTEFDESIRRALRTGLVPGQLTSSPLLRSRLMAHATGSQPGPEYLCMILRSAAEALQGSPRGNRYYRAVHRTYLDPAPTQERAAEDLNLPFSTYRRHLTAGVGLIADYLWQRELQLDAPSPSSAPGQE